MNTEQYDWVDEGLNHLARAEENPEMWEWWLRNHGPMLLEEYQRLRSTVNALHQCGEDCLAGCAYN